MCRIPAPQIIKQRNGNTKVGRSHGHNFGPVRPEPGHRGRPERGDLIHHTGIPRLAVHDQSPVPPQAGQHTGVEGNERVAEDSGQLALGARRIKQRAKHVENGKLSALGKQLAGWSDRGKGRVETGSEEKSGPRLAQHVL